ncbi:hypothetical protein D9M68_816160 [compost metagenome]
MSVLRLSLNDWICRASSPTVVVYCGVTVAKPSASTVASAPSMSWTKRSMTSSTYTSVTGAAGSLTWIGRSRAMLWQKVATAEL